MDRDGEQRQAALGQLPERLHAQRRCTTGGSSTAAGSTSTGRPSRSRACGASTPTARGCRAFSATACSARPRSWKPSAIPGTSKLLCVLTSHNGPCRGAIGIIDRQLRPQRPGGHPQPHARSQDRPGRSRATATASAGPTRTRCPLDDEFFLVSKRGHDPVARLRRHQGGRPAAARATGMGFYSPTPDPPADACRRSSPRAWPTPIATEPWADGLPAGRLRRARAARRSAARSSEICVVQEIEKSRWAPQDVHRPDRKRQHRRPSGSSSRSSPAARPTRRRRSGATPRSSRTARPTSRCPPGVPIYFMALDAKAGPCSGCGPSPTSCPARCRAASAATPTATRSPRGVARPAGRAFDRDRPRSSSRPSGASGGFSYPAIVQPVLRPALRRVPQRPRARRATST